MMMNMTLFPCRMRTKQLVSLTWLWIFEFICILAMYLNKSIKLHEISLQKLDKYNNIHVCTNPFSSVHGSNVDDKFHAVALGLDRHEDKVEQAGRGRGGKASWGWGGRGRILARKFQLTVS